jgi:2-keto-3-deoxygluconate permease
VRIYQAVNRVPGGLMVVPLFIGMLLNTFAPNALKIGGFTQALTNVGYPTILAMYLFTAGTKMTLRAAPKMLKRGLGIMFAKVGIAVVLALGVAYVAQSIETGPFVTMLVLVGAGLAVIPWLTMVSVIAPIAAGAILGNLDEELRDFFGNHEPIIVPFMAFTLGEGINLKSVTTAGLPGILLGVAVVVITGIVCITADRLLGGSGVAGAAASSTAGNAAGTPQAVAIADPTYAAIAPIATIQVAASVIVTAILTPVLTAFIHRRIKRRALDAQEVVATASVAPAAESPQPAVNS